MDTGLPDLDTSMQTVALVVAAGQGLRAGGGLPKQYRHWRGQPLLRHSVAALAAHPAIDAVRVVIGAGQDAMAQAALAGIGRIAWATGGATRRDSVRAGLEAIAAAGGAARVLIHDAARPQVPDRVVADLLAALDRAPGAVPVLPVVDSLTALDGARLGPPADREALRRVQTPQAFRFAAILAAHRAWPDGQEAGDDARVAQAAGLAVLAVAGDEALAKLTVAADFAEAPAPAPFPAPSPDPAPAPARVRVGFGYDVHRLAAGEDLWLGGVRIDHSHGLAGHSDADVLLHAITDAILGALAEGDIGDHFPPSDPRWRGAPSHLFLAYARDLAAAAGMQVAHVDATLVCEAPKIKPHREAIRASIAAIIGIAASQVSVKATTTEGLGPMGRREGIAAQAVATLTG